MTTQEGLTLTIETGTTDQAELAARIYQAAAHDLSDRLRASNPWLNLEARREDFQQAVRTLSALMDNDDGALVIARNEVGEPVGMAATMVQPPHAHLAYFFVMPEFQNRGVGRQLLAAVRQHIDDRGATVITLAASRDPRAWQRYLRWGLQPGAPQMPFRAAHPIFPLRAPEHPRLHHRPLNAGDLPALVALDEPVRGAHRAARIAAWLAAGSQGELVFERSTGQPVGYALVTMNDWWGQIGPVVARTREDFPHILQVALAAAGQIPNPTLRPWRVDASARNRLAVEPLLAAGFSLDSLVNWFETEPVGQWDRYLFRDEDEL